LQQGAAVVNHQWMAWKLFSLMGIAGVAIALAGCSLFHHDAPPQQQFLNALNHGNGPEANQIWLKMSAEDRSNFSHSVGFKPQVTSDEVQTQIKHHLKEKAAENGEDDGASPLANSVEEGDINSQIIEMPGIDADTSGGLQNLPNLPSAIESSPSPPDLQPAQ
jgi:hypothetical protein